MEDDSKETTSELDIKTLIKKYFHQLTKGCDNPYCQNKYCATSGNGIKNPNNAAAAALKLALDPLGNTFFCELPKPIVKEDVPHLDLYTFENELSKVKEEGNLTPIVRQIGSICSVAEYLNKSFLVSPDAIATKEHSGVDIGAVQRFFLLFKHEPKLSNVLVSALGRLLTDVKFSLHRLKSIEELRIFLMIPLNRMWQDPEHHKSIIVPYCLAVDALEEKHKDVLKNWWTKFTLEEFNASVETFRQFITIRIATWDSDIPFPLHSDPYIPAAVRVMEIFFKANELSPTVDYTDFYNDPLNEQLISEQLQQDFKNWKTDKFSYCNYPFILNPATKSKILLYESRIQQEMERQQAWRRTLFTGSFSAPRLVFRVRRNYLINDTLNEISRHDPADLKKTLRVHFEGEEGVDEGGVQKEFFQLIVREIFDAKYGMFVHNKETETYWFNSASEDYADFQLIGIILGIAIYNGVILDVHFPHVVYKKLTGQKSTLEDLKSVKPALAQGLQKLLEIEGDVEDILGEVFQITYEEFGEFKTRDLIEGGEHVAVTNANREEYVRLYVEFLLEESVKRQFSEFEKGFRTLCSSEFFKTFRSEELERVICGSPVLDFEELEKVCIYENGYRSDHPVIRNFWEVVHSMALDQQKKLLFFATGSDRAPIGGLGNLKFVIMRHGTDSDRLPQAHTCFNHLLLPEYSTKEKLRVCLLNAISNAEGFGMM